MVKTKTVYSSTWTKATPQQMINSAKYDLAHTPKWRLLKRRWLTNVLKFWEEVNQ